MLVNRELNVYDCRWKWIRNEAEEKSQNVRISMSRGIYVVRHVCSLLFRLFEDYFSRVVHLA